MGRQPGMRSFLVSTLQDAIRAAGLKTSTPRVVDLQIVSWADMWIFTAETWHGHQFLETHTDQRGEAIIDTAKRANELSRQAVSQGLNVTLCGKPFKGEKHGD
jgi:hypothetical protein